MDRKSRVILGPRVHWPDFCKTKSTLTFYRSFANSNPNPNPNPNPCGASYTSSTDVRLFIANVIDTGFSLMFVLLDIRVTGSEIKGHRKVSSRAVVHPHSNEKKRS